ncbi:beta-propeller fold lactonase family protein [Faecalicoccus pleomorphus]|uniref:beta-propeller fold lactonase family protein n=1 Tax=Faecalicoccus pleomorphus TaxID=1323 RepID=UPI0022DF5E96|nr:beta-propeller fold lactonase family protein [Faecalicoccus pleomorphus]
MKGYIGTYTTSRSKGIYSFDWDGNKLSTPELFYPCQDPKYLTSFQGGILAVVKLEGKGGLIYVDAHGNQIAQLVYEESPSCYVGVIQDHIYTVNYHTGVVSCLAWDGNQLTLKHQIRIQDKAGSHHILEVNGYLWVPCLMLDQIVILNFDLYEVGRIDMEKGSGPRHAILVDHYYYICGELSNILYAIDVDTRQIVSREELLVSKKDTKGTAAIAYENGKIYVSTRFSDVISVVSVHAGQMHLEQVVSSMGIHPRDFVLGENSLLVVHKDDDEVAVLKRDHNGYLTKRLAHQKAPEGVCVIWEEKE